MGATLSSYRGCLLGLAVGDAMGYTVDSRTWQQIMQDYGPNGLLGYDLVNGYAEITSYTQLAAFTCNGLLIGITRGQLQGKMAPFVRYIAHSSREWCLAQRPWGRPEKTLCWLMEQPELCRRHCMDTRMMDTLSRRTLGTPEEPVNNFSNPGSITSAVGVGLYCDPERMDREEIDRLGAEAVALMHGSPLAFLSGSVVAHIISRCARERDTALDVLYRDAMKALEDHMGHEYSQVYEITALVRRAMILAQDASVPAQQAMSHLRCETAAEVLAGAVYATLTCEHDFDRAMIAAVNHSGRSAAVGALTGAILGARMGETALPEFYIESLECAETLRELASDLYQGYPMIVGGRIFDGDWDRKYLHGGK